MLLAYLAVLGVGVFGPAPADEVNDAARRLRQVEEEIRDRLGASSTTATSSVPTTGPPTPTISVQVRTTDPAPRTPSPAPETSWWDDIRAEEFFNAVVFVPFGVLFPLCWPRLRWLTVLVGAQVSGLVELIQDLFLDWRTPMVNDVRWNTLGAAVGFGGWLVLRLLAPRLVRRLSDA